MSDFDICFRALDRTAEIVSGIVESQLGDPTPCADWDVRTVIGHLLRGNQNVAAVAEGRERNRNPIADLGPNPATEYRESVAQVRDAWTTSGDPAGLYASPLGRMTGVEVLTFRMADSVAHGWDLARATGQDPGYDDDVVNAAFEFSRNHLSGMRAPGGPFAEPQMVPDDAPPIDRLAAFLGRTV